MRLAIADSFGGVSYQRCLALVFESLDLGGGLQVRVVSTGVGSALASSRGLELNFKVKSQTPFSPTASKLSTAAIGEVESAEEHIERLLDLIRLYLKGEGRVL